MVRDARRQRGRGRHPRAARAGGEAGSAASQAGRARVVLMLRRALRCGSLLYGDGMITPAISVLGAVEGLESRRPSSSTGSCRSRSRSWSRCSSCSARHGGHWLRSSVRRRCSGSSRSRAAGLPWIVAHAAGARGAAPRPRAAIPRDHGNARLPAARLGRPVHHGRGGALRRHGPLRQPADPARVVHVAFPALLLNYFGQGAVAAQR